MVTISIAAAASMLCQPLHFALAQSAGLQPPQLISPPDNALLMTPGRDFTVTLTWSEVEGASEYVISAQITPTGGNPTLVGPLNVANARYDLSLSHEMIGGHATIRWSAQAKAPDGGLSAPSSVYRFNIGLTGTPIPGYHPTPTPLPAPNLLAPIDGTLIPEETLLRPVLFSWSSVEGAASYELVIFLENNPFLRRTTTTTSLAIALGGAPPLDTTYQWRVQAIGANNREGRFSARGHFRIGGSGIYPTPTPLPRGMDHSGDGRVGAKDLFFLASRYRTNDPAVDYNRSGLNELLDLLHFIKQYRSQESAND